MQRATFLVAWYRFGATFRRRGGGYLAIVLLVGIIGGVAMGSIAGARRTQSSFPAFLARSKSSDLLVNLTGDPNESAYRPAAVATIAQLPHVVHAESFVLLSYFSMHDAEGKALDVTAALVGSVDGTFFDQDRFSVTQGRIADPTRADELMVSEFVAHTLGLHVGQVLTISIGDQSGAAAAEDHAVRVVGIGLVSSELVQDDADRGGLLIATPALTVPLLDCCAASLPGMDIGLHLEHGTSDISAVERDITGALPQNLGVHFDDGADTVAKAERAIEPEAVALGVFGLIAAAAGLLIAGQAIGRQLRGHSEDLDVMRALGASPAMTTSDGLLGTIGAVAIGSLAAVAGAVALSGFAPIGPVRKITTSPGIAFDWTVLGVGLAVLIGVLSFVAVVVAYRGAPHRRAPRSTTAARGSSVVGSATAAGMPVSAVVGLRFTLENGRGRATVPVRAAIIGTALAVVVVTTTLTFGNSLHTLVSRPALYGWNWDYALESQGPIPPQTQTLLDHESDVAAWSGVYFDTIELDGQPVAGIAGDTSAMVTAPVLSGHAVAAPDQIVLGAATLAQLHKHLGDTVTGGVVNQYDPANAATSTTLRIVGTATMPAIGTGGPHHPSMGVGAIFASTLLPDAVRNQFGDKSGPNTVFVRLRAGADAASALRGLQQTLDATNQSFAADPNFADFGTVVALLPVQHPAEIVNYRSMGATPAILAAGLAAGATIALGLTLATSVRRRRRELALLKTLGFTRHQLSAAVAWHASITAIIGLAVGVPLGVALGRWLWILFAHQINAVPHPAVPVLSLILVAIGALVLANLVAALPGRSAARTPTAQVLRTD